MGTKLTDKEISEIQMNSHNTMLDVCLVCNGMEEYPSMRSIDPTGMSWDVVCDECMEGGTINSSYIQSYIQLNHISINGFDLHEDSMCGTIYFNKEGADYSVFATPNWETVGVIPIELITTDGDNIILGELRMNGDLTTQMETYIIGMEGFLKIAESFEASLVIKK